MKSSNKIKNFILENITQHQKDIIQTTIEKFGISRQAIHKHMNTLINDKKVIAHGVTKARYYELIPSVNFNKYLDIHPNLSVEELMKLYVKPHIEVLPRNILEIFEFSISAMINNTLEHADASKLYYKIFINHNEAHFILNDNGKGIFNNIKSKLKLPNIRSAALELTKGYVSTNPLVNSGEELNAVINLFDIVEIGSSGKSLIFENKNTDWELKNSLQKKGTRFHLRISASSDRTCSKVFGKIFGNEKSRIRIPVSLLDVSKHKVLNSRSQAKNLLRNVKNYKKVEFDFKEIDLIGPAFADALIRGAKKCNQCADIKWVNTNNTVDLLMSRSLHRQS
tara:strand:- start:102 stop:1115 length:1014 start_codon:yes stop_codon:yes gene_type:complete